jgi:hypothetical protein
MPINRDKTPNWKRDTAASVDLFNQWFIECAPKAFREQRLISQREVEHALVATGDLTRISPAAITQDPRILSTLRMACCPPLAVDRLIGLAQVNKNLVQCLEGGELPRRMSRMELNDNLQSIVATLDRMLDRDIFPWLASESSAEPTARYRAATIIADRLCGAMANPIIRNAQEKRQLEKLETFFVSRGYVKKPLSPGQPLNEMAPGTFWFRLNIEVCEEPRVVRIPVDAVVQRKVPAANRLPILIEAKSAGDFTNTNKRQKEEATKARQLREKLGDDVEFLLFLCGYFDAGYLGYEAAELIDWVWEHRIDDFDQLGLT